MTATNIAPATATARANETNGVVRLSQTLIVVALCIIFLWFGAMKFTDYEAQGVSPLIANNPLLSWLHSSFGIRGGAAFLGIFELLTGILLLGSFVSPRAGVIGGAMSVLTYLVTLSCLATTPGVFAPEAGGFPVLSGKVGQFLLKDIVLLAASVSILGHALVAMQPIRTALRQPA